MYKATGHIGYFWKGPDVDLGTYKWFFFAWLNAKLWLLDWPHSQATIVKV